MANYQYMMSADDVARELNCSKSHAYKLVKSMNEELASQGYITMAGRIPRAYWAKKMYGYLCNHSISITEVLPCDNEILGNGGLYGRKENRTEND